MRRRDIQAAIILQQAVKLLHGADHVRDMFYDVRGDDRIKSAVPKRIGVVIQIAENVGATCRIPIDAYGARSLIHAAADIQNRHRAFSPRNLA